jgi:hypothetical protein
MSEDLGRTLIDELARALPRILDDAALEELAARLHPHLASLVTTQAVAKWPWWVVWALARSCG